MLLRRVSLLALILCFVAPSAFAQDDDLLAPLTPTQSKGKPKTTKRKPPPKTAKTKRGAKGTREPEETPGGEPDLLAPLVRKTELLVKFSGATRGTRLLVDDKDLGAVSKSAVEVTPGEHAIVVRKPGYRDFSRRLTLKEGEVTEVVVALDATMAFVSVKADVSGGRVFINGEEKGPPPLEGLLLPPGSHEFTFEREGFKSDTQRLAVRAGKEYTVDFKMRPEAVASTDQPRAPVLTPTEVATPSPLTELPPENTVSKPLTSRWYFWAGVGAVAAAATVGAVMYSTSRPLSPTDVCNGTCDGIINRPAGGAGLAHF
jgi:hypothetical protein